MPMSSHRLDNIGKKFSLDGSISPSVYQVEHSLVRLAVFYISSENILPIKVGI